jgi:hypothetical protein
VTGPASDAAAHCRVRTLTTELAKLEHGSLEGCEARLGNSGVLVSYGGSLRLAKLCKSSAWAIADRINQPRCVPGMTVHQAKGKEWAAVGARFKPGQIERLAAGLSEMNPDDRLLYVALTRARKTAVLV